MRHLRHLPPREGQEAAAFLNRERGLFALLGVVVLAAAAMRVPMCPCALVLGVPCPGCGLARATLHLLRGDLRGALALHPLVFVAAPAVVLGVLHATSSSPASVARNRLAVFGAGALLVLLVAVWLARFAGAFGGPVAISLLE